MASSLNIDAKTISWFLFIAFTSLLCSNYCVFAEIPHKRFEYKYTFKGPYLAQKDGSVPFFDYGGSAIASEESVRVTPSLRSKKGFVWSKNATDFDWWEVEFVFRVTGRGRIGADGLAFWFTEEQGQEGPVFGSTDKWRGLGVFFDSFDNDNKRNNPYIMAMVNDGLQNYDHLNDGVNQQLAGCLRDYRNKPFPVRTKVEYYKNSLTLLFHSGLSDSDQDYEICFRSDNVYLPKRGYLGISAATGGLADDHDILKFLTSSLTSPEDYLLQNQQPVMSESERERLSREFDDYHQKLEVQKEEFQKQHPNQVNEQEDYYESSQQQELRQIFTGQSRMFEMLREVHRKMDEIIGRQERTLSLLAAGQMGGGHAAAGGQQQLPSPGMVDTIRRHEVDAVLNNQREIVSTANEIKSFVTDLHRKSGQQPSGHQGGVDIQSFITEMRNGLDSVKQDLTAAMNKAAESRPCPTQSVSCVSTTIFIVFAAIQLILTVGYLVYRDNREAQAKKFY